VLHERSGTPIMWIISLKPAHERDCHGSGEVGIFAEGFLASAPARIARQIGIGRADDDALAAAVLTSASGREEVLALKNVARFVGFNRGGLLQQIRVPGFAEPDRLRKLRRRQGLEAVTLPAAGTSVGNAAQAFDVSGTLNAKSRHVG